MSVDWICWGKVGGQWMSNTLLPQHLLSWCPWTSICNCKVDWMGCMCRAVSVWHWTRYSFCLSVVWSISWLLLSNVSDHVCIWSFSHSTHVWYLFANGSHTDRLPGLKKEIKNQHQNSVEQHLTFSLSWTSPTGTYCTALNVCCGRAKQCSSVLHFVKMSVCSAEQSYV